MNSYPFDTYPDVHRVVDTAGDRFMKVMIDLCPVALFQGFNRIVFGII
jgi:hypothetical protein